MSSPLFLQLMKQRLGVPAQGLQDSWSAHFSGGLPNPNGGRGVSPHIDWQPYGGNHVEQPTQGRIDWQPYGGNHSDGPVATHGQVVPGSMQSNYFQNHAMLNPMSRLGVGLGNYGSFNPMVNW